MKIPMWYLILLNMMKLVSYVKSKLSKNNYISFKKLKNDKHY